MALVPIAASPGRREAVDDGRNPVREARDDGEQERDERELEQELGRDVVEPVAAERPDRARDGELEARQHHEQLLGDREEPGTPEPRGVAVLGRDAVEHALCRLLRDETTSDKYQQS